MIANEEGPRISVILTTYNRAAVIAGAVSSVMQQDHSDFELIIVDDGSEDETFEEIRRFTGDPRVTYIWTPNRKQPAALNLGLRAARGRQVAFLDSDDEYKANHLSLLSEELEAKQLDFLLARFDVIVPNGYDDPRVLDFYRRGRTIPVREIECITGALFGWRSVFLRASGFRNMRSADTDLFNRLKDAGYTWKRVEVPTYDYYFARFSDSRALTSIERRSLDQDVQ